MLDDMLRLANDGEKKLVATILKDLIDRRADKATGEVRYGVVLSDGGIRERTIETKMKVR